MKAEGEQQEGAERCSQTHPEGFFVWCWSRLDAGREGETGVGENSGKDAWKNPSVALAGLICRMLQ